MTRRARIGYALGALFATALFAWLGTWQLGRGFAKQERLAQAQSARQSETPQPLSMAARAEDQDDEIARVEGRGRYRLPLLVLDNQQREGLVGFRVYAIADPEAVLVDLGWQPWNAERQLPPLELPPGERNLRGLLVPWPGQGLRLAATPWPADRAAPVLLTTLDRGDIGTALGIDLAPRVLRLDPALDYGYARDLDVLPNTLPPARHFGYAVQWYGLAATVIVVYLLLSRRARRTLSV